MSETWDDYAAGWDTNDAVIEYCQNAYRSLQSVTDVAGKRVLDFGCGTGLLTQKLSEQAASVIALDPSANMISVLDSKQLKNVSTINAELTQKLMETNVALAPGFDVIVASSALAFVPDYEQTLVLLKQLLKPDGVFVQWDWLSENETPGNGFSEEYLASIFKKVGFAECSTMLPFSMGDQHEAMPVVMGVAKNVK